MIDALLSLPTPLGALAGVLFTTAVGMAAYLASYALSARFQTEDLKEAINSLFRVVGILLSLFLSLTLGEVMFELKGIETAIQRESLAIADIHNDLFRFGDEETRDIRALLVEYTEAIIEDDWPALAHDRLGERAGTLLNQLEDAVLGLEASNPVQETLRARIIEDVDTIPDYRLSRLEHALAEPPFFLLVVFFAFLVTMLFFGVHRPGIVIVSLVSMYTTLVGLVLYLILAYSDPFQGMIGIESTSLEYVLERMRSEPG